MHRGEKGLSVSEVIPMSLRQIYQVYDALAQAAATLQQANFRLKCEGFVACLLVCFCVCAFICLFHRTVCSEAVSRQGGQACLPVPVPANATGVRGRCPLKSVSRPPNGV